MVNRWSSQSLQFSALVGYIASSPFPLCQLQISFLNVKCTERTNIHCHSYQQQMRAPGMYPVTWQQVKNCKYRKTVFVSAHPNKLGGGHVFSQKGEVWEKGRRGRPKGGVCASQPSFLFSCAFAAIRFSPKVHPKLLLWIIHVMTADMRRITIVTIYPRFWTKSDGDLEQRLQRRRARADIPQVLHLGLLKESALPTKLGSSWCSRKGHSKKPLLPFNWCIAKPLW